MRKISICNRCSVHVLISVAWFLLPAPASAALITNIFTGTVVANAVDGFSPATTNDFADPLNLFPQGPFGGGNLIGQQFTLTTAVDTSPITGIGNSNFFANGIGYNYSGVSPLTVNLTINGNTFAFDGQTGPFPVYTGLNGTGSIFGNEFQEQAFYWGLGGQYAGFLLGLTAKNSITMPVDFTIPLPTMTSSDFTLNESHFSRLRRAEIGVHHHIAGAYLLRHAQESSWREDNRRVSNGDQVSRITTLALKRGKLVDFTGYWQRHIAE
jgi:hypothetical protein